MIQSILHAAYMNTDEEQYQAILATEADESSLLFRAVDCGHDELSCFLLQQVLDRGTKDVDATLAGKFIM